MQQADLEIEIRDYMADPLTKSEIRTLLDQLGMDAVELVRTNEPVFETYYKGKVLSNEEWISALHRHPVLLQRPIVIQNGKAFIGRPPEKILSLLLSE